MEKFSKLKPKNDYDKEEDNILYDGDYMKIVDFKGWSVISEKDLVVCIPYLIEQNKIVLHHEPIPSFEYTDGQEYHLTIISGGIEKGESPEKAMLRELEEEAGIIVKADFSVEIMKPLFISKSHSNKFYPCILVLTENDYHEVSPKGDGSKAEKMSQPVKIDTKFLNSVNASDLITEYMMDKIKKYLNQNG